MKPKHHRLLRRALPAFIVVAMPAAVPSASADTFTPDTFGNILVPSDYSAFNGEDFTILANGGSNTTFTAVIEAGVTFTGDAVLDDAMQVTVAGYDITNHGTLKGQYVGIEATADITLTNHGTIEGGIGEGISTTGGGSLITNETGGIIRGGFDGIYFTTTGGTVMNRGTITGIGLSDGIQSQHGLRVENHGTIGGGEHGIVALEESGVKNYGKITGGDTAVFLGHDASVQNMVVYGADGHVASAGSIVSSAGDAVVAGDGSSVLNWMKGEMKGGMNGATLGQSGEFLNMGGRVEGVAGYGASVGAGSRVVNGNAYDQAASPHMTQGRITGKTDGLLMGDGSSLQNSAVIRGEQGSGVIAGNGTGAGGFTIENSGGITGYVNGVTAGNGAVILNSGEISGLLGSGILAGHGLHLELTDESIIGDVGITHGASAWLKISGHVLGTGGTAISMGDDGGVGDSLIELTGGAFIGGDVTATGTGNNINALQGVILGGISGIEGIDVQQGGYLQIYGDITTPTHVEVLVGSDLRGGGVWRADVDVQMGGKISAGSDGSPFGVLDIDGNVDHDHRSGIRTTIDPLAAITNDGGGAALIRSTGGIYNALGVDVTLEGTTSHALRDGTYVIVRDAGGAVQGGDNWVHYNGNEEAVLSTYFANAHIDGAGDLVVDLDHGYGDLPGLSKNQQAAGSVLDAFMENESAPGAGLTDDSGLRILIGELDYLGLADVQAFLAGMAAPAESALAFTRSVVDGNHRTNALVRNHLAATRSSGGTVSMPVGISSGETAVLSHAERGHVWGSFSHDWQDYEGEGDASDFDGEVSSFTAGVDYRIAPAFVVGFLLDGSQADLDGGGSTDTDSLRATLYGSYGRSGGWYSDFLLGYGAHDNSATDATSVQAMLTAGYTMGVANLRHGPFAGLEYQKVDVDGFGGGGTFGTGVEDFDVESLRGLIGYRVDGSYGRFRPYASIAYAHEFKDGGSHATATFGSASFRVEGGARGSAILLGAGTGISLTPSLTLDLGYRGEVCVGGAGMDSHGCSLGLDWAF